MGESLSEQETATQTILIGPTSMEAGWMLQFAARARFRAQNYKCVVVWCEEPYAHLFSDFANKIITYAPKRGHRDRFLIDGKRMAIAPEIVKEVKPDKIYSPSQKHCVDDPAKTFVYGKKEKEKHYHILIHARDVEQHDWIDKKEGGTRNYPMERYIELVESFPSYMNISIASIGSLAGALKVPDTIDLRGIPINELCDRMASSDVCIGTSSFPLHLANSCGCRTVVFTDNSYQKSIGGTNRKRYENLWRVTNADVVVLDKWGWKPPVKEVLKVVTDFINLKA